jgi:hypothetical protein
MADKYSVLIKYKYLEYIENAGLSDADAWVFMRGIIEYDKSGTVPKFKNPVLTGLFAVLKFDLDENRQKWEGVVSRNKSNGAKGGRPLKNPNNPNNPNNPRKPKKPSGFSETQWPPEEPTGGQRNPNNPEKPDLDLDSGSDLGSDLGYEFKKGGGGNSDRAKENSETKPPPPSFEQIKKESKAQGFFIDAPIIRQFQGSGLNPSWLIGPHSFLEFTAATVGEKYRDKPDGEKKAIYIAAVTSWEDLREEYPAWKERQEKLAKKAERERAIKKARENIPKKCQCGGELNENLVYQSCNGRFFFEDEEIAYKFSPPINFDINSEFSKMMEKYRKGKEAKP